MASENGFPDVFVFLLASRRADLPPDFFSREVKEQQSACRV